MKQLREFDYFKAWLIFFVTVTGGGAVLGIVIGSFVAAFMGAGGASLPEVQHVNQIIGLVITIPISYLTFRIVIGKYLLPKTEEETSLGET